LGVYPRSEFNDRISGKTNYGFAIRITVLTLAAGN